MTKPPKRLPGEDEEYYYRRLMHWLCLNVDEIYEKLCGGDSDKFRKLARDYKHQCKCMKEKN